VASLCRDARERGGGESAPRGAVRESMGEVRVARSTRPIEQPTPPAEQPARLRPITCVACGHKGYVTLCGGDRGSLWGVRRVVCSACGHVSFWVPPPGALRENLLRTRERVSQLRWM
jgi:hypothetical protein